MANPDGPTEPSRPTVKRLFAVSGNLCAFPKCSTPLADPKSGSIIGQICHIKGENPGASRFDPRQTNAERHGFDNLILLCNVHHKIVDDDDTSYTVERLVQMKRQHESRHASPLPVDEATSERFVSVAINNSAVAGSVVTTHAQSGGQAAHTINNFYGPHAGVSSVLLEAKLDMSADLRLMEAIGCPVMRLSVVCRSERQAKIKSAHLLIDRVDVMKGLQQGFGSGMDYTPLPGSSETMDMMFLPIARPNSQEGYVLSRDDVARFAYPLFMPSTILALRAKPEDLTITVRFFDGQEQIVLTGQPIQDCLAGLMHLYQNRPGSVKVEVTMSVRVKSTTPPGPEMGGLVGTLNKNYIPIVHTADPAEPAQPE